MFRKFRFTTILLATLIIFIGLGSFFVINQRSNAAQIPDTPEAFEIMATLDRAYELLGIPAELLDFDEFDEVFIDHPDYLKEISAERRTQMKEQITKYLGVEATQTLGYRTLMKSKRMGKKQRLTQLRVKMEEAEAENRELTQGELDEIAAQNNGYIPTLPDLSTPSSFKRELKYFSLEINGDKARATYDEGVTGRTAILVRIDGKWYVAGIF